VAVLSMLSSLGQENRRVFGLSRRKSVVVSPKVRFLAPSSSTVHRTFQIELVNNVSGGVGIKAAWHVNPVFRNQYRG